MVFFRQLELGPMANFVYLIGDPESREAAVVDPAWDVPAILEEVEKEGYRLAAALVTHNHFDHINGLPGLLKAVDVPVYVNRRDAAGVKAAAGNLRPVEGGERVKLGCVEITLLHTPGHTAGSQCLKVGEGLITGDTLFMESCGRVDLPGSDPGQMYASLRKLASLPVETTVWPGHHYGEEPSGRLGQMLQTNPYLSAASKLSLADFQRLVG